MPFAINDRVKIIDSTHPLYPSQGKITGGLLNGLYEVRLDRKGMSSVVLPEGVLGAATDSVNPNVFGTDPHANSAACQLGIGNCAVPQPVDDEEGDAESLSSSSSSVGA